jgi:hypothetical protein
MPNGLEMSRLAGEGRAAWAETSRTGSVPSAQDQTQGKDTPAGRPLSISVRWQRDPAGQVGSIELLDAQYLPPSVVRSPAGGQRALKGFGSKTRATLAGDAFRSGGFHLVRLLRNLRGRTTASR